MQCGVVSVGMLGGVSMSSLYKTCPTEAIRYQFPLLKFAGYVLQALPYIYGNTDDYPSQDKHLFLFTFNHLW